MKTKYCSKLCRGTRRNIKPKLKATKEDVAWAAGIFEGEGTVSVQKEKYIRAMVYQKDTWILKRFVNLFGGGWYKRFADNGHAWTLSGQRAFHFLNVIYPRLSPWRKK